MPKAVLFGKYSQEAWAGVASEGAVSREAQVRAMFEGLGASLDAAYWMPVSNYDFMFLLDLPGPHVMASVKKLVGPTGSVVAQEFSVIMTAEEFDATTGGSYRAPGQ